MEFIQGAADVCLMPLESLKVACDSLYPSLHRQWWRQHGCITSAFTRREAPEGSTRRAATPNAPPRTTGGSLRYCYSSIAAGSIVWQYCGTQLRLFAAKALADRWFL